MVAVDGGVVVVPVAVVPVIVVLVIGLVDVILAEETPEAAAERESDHLSLRDELSLGMSQALRSVYHLLEFEEGAGCAVEHSGVADRENALLRRDHDGCGTWIRRRPFQ